MADLENFVSMVKAGELNGERLREMVENNKISKAERRKITKLAQKKELSARQKLRLEVKEKKKMPKLSRDDRNDKFQIRNEKKIMVTRDTICLGCRGNGHLLKDCPHKDNNTINSDSRICFNCGSTFHSLKLCPEPRPADNSLPFASCFICNGKGHLSRFCTQNTNGLYPYGGCCHICFQKNHLAKDCPDKPQEEKKEKEVPTKEVVPLKDSDDYMVEPVGRERSKRKRKNDSDDE